MTKTAPHCRSVLVLAIALLAVAGGWEEEGMAPVGGATIDLSPRVWPEGDFEEERGRGAVLRQPKPLARGSEAAVVGTTGPIAVRAGMEALNQGGSAADAVLTTALTQIALTGGAWNSYAGILSLVYYDAETGEVYALDAGFSAPLEEDDPLSIPAIGIADGRTAMTPGFMAGVEAAHQRFGMLPFESLFGPALYLAEEGYEIDAIMAYLIQARQEVLGRLPATRAVFTDADGEFYEQGDVFRQPALAKTLRGVAAHGAAYMYDGPWAEAFVEAVQAEGGRITREDLERYEPTWSAPLSTTYKGVDVHVPGPSQLGGVELLEALNIVECAGAHVAKPSDESAESLYWLIQIARMPKLFTMMPAAHRDLIFGENSSDPGVRVSKEHAADLWRGIVASQEEGGPTLDDVLPRPGSDRGKHSDAVVAVDQFGNVAALTHTINCSLWGSTGLVVGGVSIPDAANFQQQRLLAAGPGGRIPNEMNPALVLRKGELVLASSCIGAGLHEVTLQALVRVLDQGLNPKQAVEAPTFLGFNWQGIAADRRALLQQVVPAWRFDDDLLKQVEAMGQRLFQVGRADLSTHNGMWIGILREEESGDYLGGVGPELNGRALAK